MQELQIKLPPQLQSDIDFLKSQIVDLKKNFQEKQPKTYLTRAEVSKMLNVSFVTLNKWNKSGRLKAVGIGSRVLYCQKIIDNSITEL